MRATEILTGDDIVKRYGGGYDRKETVKRYACEYGLGCDGPACTEANCPRKALSQGTSNSLLP